MPDETVAAAGQEPAVIAAPVVMESEAAAESVAAVAEAPAAPVAEKPPAPLAPAPAVPDPQQQQAMLLRQAYAQQAAQNRQYQLQLRNQQMAESLRQYEQQLLATLPPEHVTPVVQQRREMYLQQFAIQDAAQDQVARGQMMQTLTEQYGAPSQFLSQFNEPGAMHQAAMGYRLQQENATLKAEIAKLKQASVPPAAKGLPGTVSRGGETVTADNIDALYNQGKVSASLYRNFLNTGQIK